MRLVGAYADYGRARRETWCSLQSPELSAGLDYRLIKEIFGCVRNTYFSSGESAITRKGHNTGEHRGNGPDICCRDPAVARRPPAGGAAAHPLAAGGTRPALDDELDELGRLEPARRPPMDARHHPHPSTRPHDRMVNPNPPSCKTFLGGVGHRDHPHGCVESRPTQVTDRCRIVMVRKLNH